MRSALLILCFLLAASDTLTAADRTLVTRAIADVDGDGRLDSISIEMTDGRRYKDDRQWCGSADKYEGFFVIVVSIGDGRVETRLNPFFGNGPMWFRASSWNLALAHYNTNGEWQFNLGQYESCNSWSYRVFSIPSSGEIYAVSDRFSVSDFEGSTSNLFPVENGFRVKYYDNSRGGNWEMTYRWDPAGPMFRFESERRVD